MHVGRPHARAETPCTAEDRMIQHPLTGRELSVPRNARTSGETEAFPLRQRREDVVSLTTADG